MRKIKLLPDVEELKKMFYLDSSIPEGLRWKIRSARCVSINDPAGCIQPNRYFATGINGKLYLNHRIIFSIYNNINLTSKQIVDHQDRCPQNNNPNNLRTVSKIENGRNRTKQKNTSSRHKGVSFHKRNKKYQARIRVDTNLIYLGYFQTEKDAAIAYNNYIISNNLSYFNLNIIE